MRNALAALVVAGTCVLLGACDHTRLTGTIHAERDVLRVGEATTLRLDVPAELDAIHRVLWEVYPPGRGSIQWTRADTGTADREATFTASEPGDARIVAAGFYRQTNPQTIAEIDLTIQSE